MDSLTLEQRKKCMSSVKRKDTSLEVIVRKYLFSKGLRFRKNDAKLFGTPDIVLPKYKTAIFVNGCFWHSHTGCKYSKLPQNNHDFWSRKISANVLRDTKVDEQLKASGWNVVRVWGCELSNRTKQEETLTKLLQSIVNNEVKK